MIGFRKVFISSLFALYFILAALWSVPFGGMELQKIVRDGLSPAFVDLGLWQAWSMFAPAVPRDNFELKYELVLGDGRVIERFFIQPHAESFFGATVHHKFTKWTSNLASDDTKPIWSDLARNIVARAKRESLDVRRVKLWRLWEPILSPTEKWVAHREPISYSHSFLFFDYLVPEVFLK